jgi:transglutaminase-like putative cysteine protease
MSEDENIMSLASKIAGEESSTLGIVLNLVDWFIENTTYANNEAPQYPNETLSRRGGDCDDQAILLISMLRGLGVPAFLQVGIVINERLKDSSTSLEGHVNIIQEGIGWHGWAMVYVQPWGWIPVDLTFNREMKALDLLSNAPEYDEYVIPALNISRQSYVNESRVAREYIIQNELYLSIVDKAYRIRDGGVDFPNRLILLLGTVLGLTIILMFFSWRRS